MVLESVQGRVQHFWTLQSMCIETGNSTYEVLTNAIGIAEFCHAHQASGYYFQQIGSCLDNVLYIIAQSISRIMDKESSLLEERFIVSEGICEELDRQLDECLGDSQMSILEQESRIMMNLIAYIQSNISPLIKLLDLIAELDCLFALSIAAQEHNLTCPTILPPGSGIQIKNGRHPLQELNVESFVPNDFQAQKVHILTGPNACGKSVYLKQVTNALLNSTRHSLIILDEFGKGTLEMDGLALLTSSLNHLIAKHDECPLVLVATHFFSLASLLKPEVPIQQLTFKHRMEEEDIVYLYSIEEGNATCSLAHQVALSCGLPPAVVKRGQDILETFRTNQTIEPIPDQLRTMRLNRINAMTESFKSLRIENEEDLQKLINSLRQIL
uniref:MutS protein homolog 5 n=2 Tax=Cacopsylla melanoneura TaxID=428564 RepID=A0A8D9AFU7_9HEMI